MKKKKKSNLNQKLLFWTIVGVISVVVLWFFEPLRNDIYQFYKNKGYLALREKYQSFLKVFSDKTSIIAIRSVAFVPYRPKNPQAEGQRKALIVAEIKIRNKRLANNVRIKFDIDDGAGRRVNSEEWDAIAKQQSLVFSMFYPDIKFVTWSPDIPPGIEDIARNRENPFKLWLIVKWQDVDKKEHQLQSYSELRYDGKSGLYYFDERENRFLY